MEKQLIIRRIASSITTLPNKKDWILLGILFFLFSAIVLPLGFISHFLTIESVNFSAATIFRCFVVTLITPAILEELFYRVILLPHNSEDISNKQKSILGSISLIIYVLSHPLNGLTFYKIALPTFTDPVFLFDTTLLGIICTIIYWRSGSLWSSVIIHWLVVAIWLMFLGGGTKLNLI